MVWPHWHHEKLATIGCGKPRHVCSVVRKWALSRATKKSNKKLINNEITKNEKIKSTPPSPFQKFKKLKRKPMPPFPLQAKKKNNKKLINSKSNKKYKNKTHMPFPPPPSNKSPSFEGVKEMFLWSTMFFFPHPKNPTPPPPFFSE